MLIIILCVSIAMCIITFNVCIYICVRVYINAEYIYIIILPFRFLIICVYTIFQPPLINICL